MNQEKQPINFSPSTLVLLVALSELKSKFRDDISNIEKVLHNLKQNEEYKLILKRAGINPDSNDWYNIETIEQSLKNLTYASGHKILVHLPLHYQQGVDFERYCNEAKAIFIKKGIEDSTLEQFAKNFKKELTKIGDYK